MSKNKYLDLAGLTFYDRKIKDWIKSRIVDIAEDAINALFIVFPPDNEIWYTSSDGNIVTPYKTNNIVSNTYEDGKGIIKFDGPVTSIVSYTFRNCTSLTSIIIPPKVTSIESMAFWDCSSLTSVILPNSITTIGNYTFQDCSSLTSINIPNSVMSIGAGAFVNCLALNSIVIPNSVTVIGKSAFVGCTSIGSIVIPESVVSIIGGASPECYSIVVDSRNTTYDSRENCNAIIETATNTLVTGCRNTIITNSVASIGDWAFNYCSGLTSITIPNSITSIGSEAFFACESLTSITIPNSVTSIGSMAFSWCPSITSIVVDTDNTIYDSRENCNAIIETTTNTLLFGCQNTIIPNNVTSIEAYAFYGCTTLTSITIPNSVTSIGNAAFQDCETLTSIAFDGTMEQWNSISKKSSWKRKVPATYVQCSDGQVAL